MRTFIENSAFLVENNRFTRVGRRGEIQPPAGATRVDLTGKTVIPALTDTHNHLGWTNQRTDQAGKENFTREGVINTRKINRVFLRGTEVDRAGLRKTLGAEAAH